MVSIGRESGESYGGAPADRGEVEFDMLYFERSDSHSSVGRKKELCDSNGVRGWLEVVERTAIGDGAQRGKEHWDGKDREEKRKRRKRNEKKVGTFYLSVLNRNSCNKIDSNY